MGKKKNKVFAHDEIGGFKKIKKKKLKDKDIKLKRRRRAKRNKRSAIRL